MLLPSLGQTGPHDDECHARVCVGVLLRFFVNVHAVCLMLVMMCCGIPHAGSCQVS